MEVYVMEKILSEQKVLKKLGIEDFRHLTKDKVITMASMLDRMDPEVAKKALEQFPEFAKTTKEMLAGYKDSLDKGMSSNEESVQAFYEINKARTESLQRELDKEGLSFEQKKYIMDEMKEIANQVDKKDTENKKFILGMATLGAGAFIGAMGILASALGGNTKIETNDYEDKQ